ncbi:mandelate racemase/muconate lactonizing enzyme family protein [Nonomuraea sediminis]|uniref:mandelate racemase/muconate lactonizing enzyme family protein n=1 Tax=Nonomuraea sediminis TaxID=2835864 RepID=UPI001BDC57CB|nr:dipeptide epimerase [Nonomuraea sediminis]
MTYRISAVDVFAVRLPLREPFVISYGTFPDVPTVLVRVRTAEGAQGWGEATPDAFVTGESYASTTATVRDLAPVFIGHDARDLESAHREMDARVTGVPTAKAAFDIALHDLTARIAGLPVWALLGGRTKDHLAISRVVSMREPGQMAEDAAAHVAAGFRTVKIKVGSDPLLDARRVAAVREAVGPETGIKVDVNQGWQSAGRAIAAIRACEPYRALYFEQPVAAWDLEGLADVRHATGATIMVDEGCHTARDLLRIAGLRAADMVNIKLMKCGGLLPGVKLNAIAEAAGIGAMVGTMVESSIASAAGLHLAIALANIRNAEMGGPLLTAADIGDAGSWYAVDRITVPDRPGLGITVDETALKSFTEASWSY